MEGIRSIPDIRFTGFDDPWEERKLSEIVDRVTRKNVNLESTLPLTISAQYGLVDQVEYFNNRVASQNISNYFLVKKGEFAYNKSSSDGYPFGAVKRLDLYEMGVLSTLYIVFALKDPNVNSDFLACYYDTDKWHKQVSERAAEGARNHGLLNISAEDFLDASLLIPQDIQEQKITGEFLKKLDTLITLHQRKYERLKDVKKSMLEKMFPRNGSNVPEIRFAGFADPWEQRKLSAIYRSIRNAFVGTATPYYVSDGHFYLESNNVKDGQINRNSEVFINDEFYYQQKDKWLRTNDMVMVQSGHVGHAAVIPENLDKTAAHALIMFTDQIEETEPYFLNYQYQTAKSIRKISDITKGNTIKHILSSDMQNFVVDVPSLKEQKRIAQFFQELDTLITLHQHKYEKLQNIKKAMLEKMFV